MLRFTLVTGAWFVGLFGLMRLPWVERTILAFPAAWGARLRGAAVGLTVITALNVVRLGNLSLVAEDQALLDVLHVYVWPGILILAAAGFVYAWMGWQGRGAARGCLAIGVGAVAAFAAAPVLGAVVGGAVTGLQGLAGHAGHAFADDQGAWAILPAFQVGLFTALWIAVAGGGRSWRRALLGLGGVVLAQGALGVPVGELAHHYGFDPHVGLIRGWALVLPAAAVWWLGRPPGIEVIDVSPVPPRALPLPG